MKKQYILPIIGAILMICTLAYSQPITYPIVDTDLTEYTDHTGLITMPAPGEPFYGQDATYAGNQAAYTDNGNGTITDQVTGLVWEKDMGDKMSWADAMQKADTLTTGGFDDWRVPDIKELYSLILFSGRVSGASAIQSFINTDFFIQPLGDPDIGEREIDAQTWSSTQYTGLTMMGDSTVFGVNFVDGRIKGYPKYKPGSNNSIPNLMYFRMVRGNPSYGSNLFVDNGNGTVSDQSTGLMWQQADDSQLRDWEGALDYAESLVLAGKDDWRLPNAKELQSIVDYSRSPQATGSPAIDPLFYTSTIVDPAGNSGHYPYFWSSTTHQDGPNPYSSAVYLAFGEALGEMNGNLMDVHGAGSQRSDPKSGDVSDYPQYHGPQGDVRYVYNAVRCVRNIDQVTKLLTAPGKKELSLFPNPASERIHINLGDDLDHHVSFTDLWGRQAFFQTDGSGSIEIRHLHPGLYLVQLDGTSVGKFMKR